MFTRNLFYGLAVAGLSLLVACGTTENPIMEKKNDTLAYIKTIDLSFNSDRMIEKVRVLYFPHEIQIISNSDHDLVIYHKDYLEKPYKKTITDAERKFPDFIVHEMVPKRLATDFNLNGNTMISIPYNLISDNETTVYIYGLTIDNKRVEEHKFNIK